MNDELMQRARALLDGPTRYPEATGASNRAFCHLMEMTGEGLNSQKKIAWQLAVRDDTIAELLDEIKRLRAFHNLHCMDEELWWCKCGTSSSGITLECRNCGGAVEGAVLLTPNAELNPNPEMPS